jgi:hypothetical protein
VWWPAERQPPASFFARPLYRDVRVGSFAGTLLGVVLALVWLLWRGMLVPPFPRSSGKAWIGTLSSMSVSLVVAAVVLAVQNIPPGVH